MISRGSLNALSWSQAQSDDIHQKFITQARSSEERRDQMRCSILLYNLATIIPPTRQLCRLLVSIPVPSNRAGGLSSDGRGGPMTQIPCSYYICILLSALSSKHTRRRTTHADGKTHFEIHSARGAAKKCT